MNDELPVAFRWPIADINSVGRDCNSLSDADIRRLKSEVDAISTTRNGGVSEPPFHSLNLGYHTGDVDEAVRENRRRLKREAGGDVEFCWIAQVHGTDVTRAESVADADGPVEADACVSKTAGLACAILTADCLPVLFCDTEAKVVAASHAGWRGLSAGVLESTVEAMETDPADMIAWLGPAIGADVYEVGDEVKDAFVAADPEAIRYFDPSPFNPSTRLVADLAGIARHRLQQLGVESVVESGACTYSDEERFFSYRRDGRTGRQASAIWLK